MIVPLPSTDFNFKMTEKREFHIGRQLERPLSCVNFLKVVSYLKKKNRFLIVLIDQLFQPLINLLEMVETYGKRLLSFSRFFHWSSVTPVTGEVW